MQPSIKQIEPFDTNEFKGDKLTLLDPNHVRIFYMNINCLKLGQWGQSLLQLCLTLKEKGVDIVCLTETNVYWSRAYVYHKFRQTLKDTWPNIKLGFVPLNQISHRIRTINQEKLQYSPWTISHLQSYKTNRILQVWDVGHS